MRQNQPRVILQAKEVKMEELAQETDDFMMEEAIESDEFLSELIE